MIDKIKEITGAKENTCNCKTCQNMCETLPCLGTPQDILRLINNGHIHNLNGVVWAAGLSQGIPIVPMVQLRRQKTGACILYENGLCKIHTLNIKPSEGVLATCSVEQAMTHKMFIPFAVALEWLKQENYKTIDLIVKAMETYDID